MHQLKVEYGFLRNYVYLIVDRETRYAAIVDPSGEWHKVQTWLMEKQVNLKSILITHTHDDHIQLVEPLVRMYDPQVYVSRKEAEYYQYFASNLNLLDEWDCLCIGRTRVEVLLTPGHSAGSVCYLLDESLISGDTLFAEGCGICSTPGGDAEQMFRSLQMIKRVVPPYTKVYPGHSYGKPPGQTFESILEYNIYLQLDKQEHFISFRMRKNQVIRNPY
ncbi:MBL fold metallo-hydrolase [Paenibacillus sp. S150]|nr:MBL fold metallo-hydrolase [Paenibacillus sp. S150]